MKHLGGAGEEETRDPGSNNGSTQPDKQGADYPHVPTISFIGIERIAKILQPVISP
jgi:hypothetical protein